MLRAGQDPSVLPPRHALHASDLNDDCPMDEDELLDYSDQEPLPSLLLLECWD